MFGRNVYGKTRSKYLVANVLNIDYKCFYFINNFIAFFDTSHFVRRIQSLVVLH